jgi:hypothetical protein
MKVIKTLTCVIAAVATLTLGASSAHAVISTTANDIILNLALTISTNTAASVPVTASNYYTVKMLSAKLVNKNLLAILGGNDFAKTTFGTGDQIAIAYDYPWNGDVVVVDKSGSNVLYDATYNYGNSNNATFAINLSEESGTFNEKYNYKPSGAVSVTAYDSGSFTLLDGTNNLNLTGSGPSAVTFNQTLSSTKTFSTNPFSAWADSSSFSFYGSSNESALSATNYVTVSGTIKGRGKGKGENAYFYTNYVKSF